MKLVREDLDPPAEEGAQSAGFAGVEEFERSKSWGEGVEAVGVPAGEAFDNVPAVVLVPAFGVGAFGEGEREEGVALGGKLESVTRPREVDRQSAAIDGLHDPRTEFPIVRMDDLVPHAEGVVRCWGQGSLLGR
jgi:hypothetical protein